MARPSLEQEIDRLYQLPQAEFTAARNALANEFAGIEAKRVRALPKPSTAAWAVNQLYWRERSAYDALIDAAGALRAAHRAVLGGRKADLREADAAHRDALKAALASTLRLLSESGQTVTSATQTDISRTLEVLPVESAPGRLARPLSPGGFEALEGMAIAPRKGALVQFPTAAPVKAPQEKRATQATDTAAAVRRRKEALRALEAARDRARDARAAVSKHQKQLAAAERRAASAKNAWDRAEKDAAALRERLKEAEASLETRTAELKKAETAARM